MLEDNYIVFIRIKNNSIALFLSMFIDNFLRTDMTHFNEIIKEAETVELNFINILQWNMYII